MKIIDFETASEANIKEVGAWAYAMHPSTRVLMLRYTDEESGSVKGWDYDEPWPGIDPAEGLIAHNVEFELAIWNFALRRTVPGRKPFRPEHAHDTAALAAAAGLPRSLDGAAKALKLPNQKDEAGGRLIKLFSVLAPGETHKSKVAYPKEWGEFGSYCADDVRATLDLWQALPKLSPVEREIFITHLKINMRGVLADIPRIRKLRGICLAAEAELTKGPHGPLMKWPPALVTYLSMLGIEIENAESENLEAALVNATGEAEELIQKRLEFAKASTKKFKRAIATDCGDGRLRGMHVYFGAHTGRWSGAGLQPQNIIRACVQDIDHNVQLLDSLPEQPAAAIDLLGGPGDALRWASWMVRPTLKASPGKLLGAADYSAIEARELSWLVDASRLQALYQAGKDPYKDMAGFIYGMMPDEVEKDSHERWVGKQVILGCGYGMGWVKFMERCAAEGRKLPEDEARGAINAYRELNFEIPDGWRLLDEVVARVLEPSEWNRGRYVFGQKLIIWAKSYGDKVVALLCRLPSGRIISWKYPKFINIPGRDPERGDDRILTYLTPQHGSAPASAVIRARIKALAENDGIEFDPAPYLRQCTVELEGFNRTVSWGGKLIENIVQAISRDLLAEAMVRVDQRFPIVMHVHDQVVAELDSPEQEPEFIRLMEVVPEWNSGAMISVEAWTGERYRK